MTVTIIFRGSFFNQKDPISLDIQESTTLLSALKMVSNQIPHLRALLFKDDIIRDDILIFIDKMDAKAMNLLEINLIDGQIITIIPLAHGG